MITFGDWVMFRYQSACFLYFGKISSSQWMYFNYDPITVRNHLEQGSDVERISSCCCWFGWYKGACCKQVIHLLCPVCTELFVSGMYRATCCVTTSLTGRELVFCSHCNWAEQRSSVYINRATLHSASKNLLWMRNSELRNCHMPLQRKPYTRATIFFSTYYMPMVVSEYNWTISKVG
jgi:hypothetical protein